jgi:hypothetical protein
VQIETPQVETLLAALKSPSQLAKACGRSRFWIIGKHNDGSLPFVKVGHERKSTLEQLWEMLQTDSEAERTRLGIKPKPPKRRDEDRAARVTAAKRALGCGTNQGR